MMYADVPPSPPAAAMSHGQAGAFLAPYPHAEQNGVSYAILQLTVRADRAELDRVGVKLKSEGWRSELQQARDGAITLAIGLEERSIDEALTLLRRLQAGEFGAVTAETMALPDTTK